MGVRRRRHPVGYVARVRRVPRRIVWECDPTGGVAALVRPALGKFVHEAAAVDPGNRLRVLTEDEDDGRLYCFRPTGPDLGEGNLFAASVDAQS